MKILMIISEAPPVKSGVARVAEQLSSGLYRRGHTVDILSLPDVPRYEFGEVRLSSMPLKMGELRGRFSQYDLIHLHGPVPTFSDVFLLWGLRGLGRKRPRLAYTYHAPIDLRLPLLQPAINLYNWSQERLANLADAVIVSTPSYAQRLQRYVPAHKLSVVPWGVDYARFFTDRARNSNGARQPFTVLYLGQIRPYKGLPVLLDAVQGMQETRLWVIGNGHYAEACQQQAARLDLEDVTFFGHLSDAEVVEKLKQAHVLVLPSITRSEAFGIVLLEGMAAGAVPVASHLPGVADVVGNEGYTFKPGAASDLRQILLRLRDDDALRQHMASLAQQKARLYSWERTVFGYERIFNTLVETAITKPLPLAPVPVNATQYGD